MPGTGDNDPIASTSSAPSSGPARKRASKACENCRFRRIKCSGDIPCRGCVENGVSALCEVRTKARPARQLSSRVLKKARREQEANARASGSNLAEEIEVGTLLQDGSSTLENGVSTFSDIGVLTTVPSSSRSLDPAPQNPDIGSATTSSALGASSEPHPDRPDPPWIPPRDPLMPLQEFITQWCITSGVSIGSLDTPETARLPRLEGSPLPQDPQDRDRFELSLMEHLVTAPDLDRYNSIDKPRLWNTYQRYRALPNSLTDDQLALVLASLCISRFSQVLSLPQALRLEREDVTYHRMAQEALSRWARPSTIALWAYFCLISYAFVEGGKPDIQAILTDMAWQVTQLGIHRRSIAQLYPQEEMAGPLFAVFTFCDVLAASLSNLTPILDVRETDVDAPPVEMLTPPSLATASRRAINFIRDYHDPHTDITSNAYVERMELNWSAELVDLRKDKGLGTQRVKSAWAELRYHWLRIMLHAQRIPLPEAQATTYIYLSRAASHIIHLYTELNSFGRLDPSWPQLKRIDTCGQILILCCSKGELHPLEAQTLFEKLVKLLEAHVETWPDAADTAHGFVKAVRALGIYLPTDHPSALSILPDYDQGVGQDMPLWPGIFLDFDPNTLLNLGTDEFG